MRNTMKLTLTALASLAVIPAAVSAHTVKAPHPGRITALTTYPSSGGTHNAVDIASGSGCNYWGVQTGVVGSVYWNVIIRAGYSCNTYGTGSGTQNEARHTWADGAIFKIWHFNKTAKSVDKTCDRCQVGDEGATGNVRGVHTHMQQTKYGVYDTSWYRNYSVVGEQVDRTETIGVLD